MADPRIRIGDVHGPVEGRIDDDAALAYARATNDPNPVYEEGDAVPPVYTVSLVLPTYFESQGSAVEPGAVQGTRGGVHAEHDLVIHRPLARGANVSWTASTSGAHQTKAGVLVTQHIVVSDDDGPAIEHFWTTMLIGGTTAESVGAPLLDHTFPEDARERPIGSHTFSIARDQSFRYGGASGDRALMHIDDEAGRRAGFPAKFMQGLCTFAMCSGAVVKLAAAGDPDRVRRLAARFAAPAFPGDDLVVTVYDAGTSAGGTHAYAFEAESNGVTVIRHGRADVA